MRRESIADVQELIRQIAAVNLGIEPTTPVYLYPSEAQLILWQFFCCQWTMLFSAVLYGRE